MEKGNHGPSISPMPAPNHDDYLQSWKLGIVISTLFLGIFLFGLDVNIIGVAIPKITSEFGSLDKVAWYGSAYLLTVTAFQPGFGNLYRFFNAKLIYLLSIVIFEAGSAICASAPASNILIFGRALLGVGAAGLLQGALAIISYSVPLEKVPVYQGVVTGAIGISVSVGPVIGGALTHNVPAGGLVILIVLLFVPLSRSSDEANKQLPMKEKLRRMDLIGTIVFLGSICCLLLGLVWGGHTYPWQDSRIIGLFVGSGLLAILFCYWLWMQGEMALIPLRILRKRSIAMGAVTLFAINITLNIYGYYLPLFFQAAQGVGVTESGIRQMALVLPEIVAVGLTGFVVTKWGYYVPYMIGGTVIGSIGAGLLTTLDVDTPTANWAIYLFIFGVGAGMSLQLPYTAVQAVLDPSDVATGNAIAVFSSQLSGAIGLSIGQDLLVHKLYIAIPQHTDAISPARVVEVGASALAEISPSPEVLAALRQSYADAMRWTLILAVASMCIAVPSSCAMEWLNIRKVAEQRVVEHEMQRNSSSTKPDESRGDLSANEKDEKKTMV
ncbi:MFS general substrate transporter [Glarea lozoyensis ATCC 20868]|uniref:MFS general substrate transporter n=1 Tax=Glarea lozoyensis (strain ATCC 20868 / MF5171) TaxID=1116229 RepID=S3DFI3_GLAL2|nr:MFS general substrate transporter [Glarea lozoyensis ATCC 20868]EPE37172.1 MFS general substrate transporter [Glarea lozoyensis ATCC 20868]